MNDTEQKSATSEIDVARLARAIRFAFATIVLTISFFSVRTSLSIGSFLAIFKDMLSGRPLPVLTVFIIDFKEWIILFSLLLPLCVIGTLFLRNLARSFYILGVLALVTIIEFVLLSYGLCAPLFQVMKNLTAP